MKLAFVFAPYAHKRFEENIFVVDEDFGVFPPLNVAYAAAIAERAGHQVRIFDANALIRARRQTAEQILDDVARFNPDAVGLYFSTYMFRDTLEWAEKLKQRLGRPIIAGGINCSLYPRETLGHAAIDYAVIGHGHQSLPRLLDAIDNGTSTDIEGVARREDRELVLVEPPRSGNAIDFDSFPLPARHLLPNELYYSFISQRKNFTIAMTSLGCPYDCSFCAIAPLPRGERSVDNVMAEIEEVHRRYGVREIDFFDACFLTPAKRAAELLERMAAGPADMEYSCRARVDNIDESTARAMRRAGIRQVYLGIESSEPAILERLHKRHRPSEARRAVAILHREGIRALGFFMLGNPGETLVTAIRTILYALSLDLSYAQFSRTIAKPGTALYNDLRATSGTDYWRDWVLGIAEERRLPSPWTELSNRDIELLTKIAYGVFYYRPTYIIRALRRMTSMDELSRSARTALRMLARSVSFD